MKINESNILRCDFEKKSITNKSFMFNKIRQKTNIKILGFVKDEFFEKKVEYYDLYLEGVLEDVISIYKCKSKYGKYVWVCNYNNQFFKIDTIKEILDLNDNIAYDSNMGFLYIIKSNFGYKIGKSKNIHNRRKIFEVKLPFYWFFYKIYKIRSFKSFNYSHLEKLLHKKFKRSKLDGEWFDLNENDLKLIDEMIINPS